MKRIETTEIGVRMTMNKKIIIAGIAVLMGFLMTACGNSSSVQGEAAMNTIQPYVLSEAEEEIVDVVLSSSSSITQFTVDETYKHIVVGYDYYEKGKLVAKSCDKCQLDLSYDAGAQTTFGKIYTNIDSDYSEITIRGKESNGEETNSLGSKDPLSNEDQTLDDMSGITTSTLESPVEIEKNKKIYIWATIGDNDDEMEVCNDVSTILNDKAFKSYDKCFLFYAIFK